MFPLDCFFSKERRHAGPPLRLFDRLIKAQRGITLLQYSAADYTPEFIFQLIFVMVFDNQQSIFGQQAGGVSTELIENLKVIGGVRGIEEDNIPGDTFPTPSLDRCLTESPANKLRRFCLNYLSFLFWNLAEVEVRFDKTAHLSRAIDKGDWMRAARQRFDANRS